LKNIYSQWLAVGLFLLICLCSCGNSVSKPASGLIDTAQATINSTPSPNQPITNEANKTEPNNTSTPATEENVLVVNADEVMDNNEIVVSAEAENDENDTPAEEEPSKKVKTLLPQEVIVDINFSEVSFVDITNRGFGQSYRLPLKMQGLDKFSSTVDFPAANETQDTLKLIHKRKYRVIVYQTDRKKHSIRKAASFVFDKKFDPKRLKITVRTPNGKKQDELENKAK
jgi:hypothetical protein